MSMMQVEQAVFASSDRGAVKGYHLVACSAGLDRHSGEILARWAPTRLSSDDSGQWIISSFPMSNDRYAVARTVIGGPEYSLRGGSQVVTLFLILNREQYCSYGYDPIAVAENALATGWMRLPLEMPQETLPRVFMFEHPVCSPKTESYMAATNLAASNMAARGAQSCRPAKPISLLEEVVDLIESKQRVAVLGLADPMAAAAQFVASLSVDCREKLSLTTGLTPSVRRPFQLHFFASEKVYQAQKGSSQPLVCVHA